ncbi:MAG TPA: TIGR00730 family Rossman fold protein [Rhodocyclaceae bacterium]
MRAITVFCGSATGKRPLYREAAEGIGRLLARRGITLVYGGGDIGLMGRMAEAALQAGGEVIGVIPEALQARELGHPRLTRLEVVDSMHTRKARMAELADGFIALPGGFGTFEEFCEVLTWGQLGFHKKPCGLLDVDGYYAPLQALFGQAESEGFLQPEHRRMVCIDRDAEALLEKMATYQPPDVEKWLSSVRSL